jgi:hypothetical protein
MDDALMYRPSAFRMLRSFWRRSFIKVDDDEDQALADLVLRANRTALELGDEAAWIPTRHREVHARIRRTATRGNALDSKDLVLLAADGTALRHEMALEAALCFQLAHRDPSTERIFGRWDFVTHQLVASPAKPPDYNDWIDVFGWTLIPGSRTVGYYRVVELKKGVATSVDVEQVMKYVDWVKDEYCFGDYGLIRAYLVAHSFDDTVFDAANSAGRRLYTKGRRPPYTLEWGVNGELSLVTYRTAANGRVRFRA